MNKEKLKELYEENKMLIKPMIIIMLVILLLFSSDKSEAGSNYSFPYSDSITMDVVKTYGGGGTWVCPSVRACYIRVLEAEARGAAQYCESITIKRDGRVIWWRKYR
jgi:hypothetical protein